MGNVKINWDKLKPAGNVFGGGRGILTPFKPGSAKTSAANSQPSGKSAHAATPSALDPAKKT